jgi:hypothetical protein
MHARHPVECKLIADARHRHACIRFESGDTWTVEERSLSSWGEGALPCPAAVAGRRARAGGLRLHAMRGLSSRSPPFRCWRLLCLCLCQGPGQAPCRCGPVQHIRKSVRTEQARGCKAWDGGRGHGLISSSCCDISIHAWVELSWNSKDGWMDELGPDLIKLT